MRNAASVVHAQANPANPQTLQRCVEYSSAGDLLEAQVTQQSFELLLTRSTGDRIELTGDISTSAPYLPIGSLPASCQLVVSDSSTQGALAVATDKDLNLELIDLRKGSIKQRVLVPKEFPIQFSIRPIGYLGGSDKLEVSQAHYLPAGEPEVVTKLISPDGTVTAGKALGAPYTEVFESSFDFRNGLVWFFCPVYAARWDQQPPWVP
jgi:hypothetical protein